MVRSGNVLGLAGFVGVCVSGIALLSSVGVKTALENRRVSVNFYGDIETAKFERDYDERIANCERVSLYGLAGVVISTGLIMTGLARREIRYAE
jgi:hypothetical protein